MKQLINKILKPFNVELHGVGFMRKLRAGQKENDPFAKQVILCKAAQPVIFDVGANKGQSIDMYRRYFPTAQIHSFEPIPELREQLEKHRDEKVEIHTMALSDKVGEATFHVNQNSDTSSLLESTKIGASSDQHVVEKKQITVKTYTVDQFCEDHKIDFIDILKLDTQGAELSILKGAAKMLGEKKIGLIFTESYFKQQYKGQPLFAETVEYLNQKGYFVEDIYNPYYNAEHMLWCDFIAQP